MRIITLPFGFVMKFGSVAEAQKHVDNLQGMIEWAGEELKANRPVALTYAVYEDTKNDERIRELLAEFPYIAESTTVRLGEEGEILGVVVESRRTHRSGRGDRPTGPKPRPTSGPKEKT